MKLMKKMKFFLTVFSLAMSLKIIAKRYQNKKRREKGAMIQRIEIIKAFISLIKLIFMNTKKKGKEAEK